MKEVKIGVIIQARMGSSRLPGKILKKLSNNETVLGVLIKRLKLSKFNQEIIVATSYDKKNVSIVEVAKKYEVKYFTGSEDNVLDRYFKAAKKFNLDLIVRITSDCPFVDPIMLDDMISFYIKENYDYMYNIVDGLTNIPIGFDIEIFSFKTLKRINKLVKTDKDKEHVSSYINHHPDSFSIYYYNDERYRKIENLRFTIDFQEDLEFCRELYKGLIQRGKPIDFSIHDIIEVLEDNPEIIEINKHIANKPLIF